jgi:uncharacterized membrane protein
MRFRLLALFLRLLPLLFPVVGIILHSNRFQKVNSVIKIMFFELCMSSYRSNG